MSLLFLSASELPYVVNYPSDGRIVAVAAFYDVEAKQWYAYPQQGPNKFLQLKPLDFKEGVYISKTACDIQTDIYFHLTDLSAQYFSFPGVLNVIHDLEDDFLNAIASVEKYFILLAYCNTDKSNFPIQIITTELEYAFGNHRSFYDGIQKIISIIYKTCHPKKPQFPDTFRKLATKPKDELRDKYYLSQPLIEFYKTREQTFMSLREIRDNIFHNGLSPDFTFSFQDGFAIRVGGNLGKSLEQMNLWPNNLQKPNSLGSMLAIFEFLIRDMSDAMANLGHSIISSFQQPPAPIYAGFKFFLRSSLVKHLNKLDEYRNGHWFSPDDILKKPSKSGLNLIKSFETNQPGARH